MPYTLRKQLFATLVLPFVLLLQYNATTNWHFHTVQGIQFTHAHPYPKSQDEPRNHHHNASDYLLLVGFQHLDQQMAPGTKLPQRVVRLLSGNTNPYKLQLHSFAPIPHRGRAPPVASAA